MTFSFRLTLMCFGLKSSRSSARSKTGSRAENSVQKTLAIIRPDALKRHKGKFYISNKAISRYSCFIQMPFWQRSKKLDSKLLCRKKWHWAKNKRRSFMQSIKMLITLSLWWSKWLGKETWLYQIKFFLCNI